MPDKPAPTPASNSTFHIFLLLGQSNMAGYPQAQASDKVENSRIKVLGYDECSATGRHTDQWNVACPPLYECGQGAIGPGELPYSGSCSGYNALVNQLPGIISNCFVKIFCR